MLNTVDDVRKVRTEIHSSIESTPGSSTDEKVAKWFGDHLGVDDGALRQYVETETDIPSDPKAAFLLGTQMGGGFAERANRS